MNVKTLLIASAMSVVSYASFAQVTAKVGPELGFGINSMLIRENGYDDDVYAGGFAQFGGTGDIQFGRWFAIRPSVMFNFNTNQYTDDYYKENNKTINTNNVYIPLDFLATFRFGNGSKMFMGLGPYLSYSLGGKFKYYDYDSVGNYVHKTESLQLGTGVTKDLKPLDVGLNFKLGFQMRSNLFFNCSFNLGLTNRAPVTDNGYKIKDQQLFAFGIGYLFGAKEEVRSKHHIYKRSSR